MALATLSVDLIARLAQFESDMGRAVRVTEQASQKMAASLGKVGTAVKAAIGGVTVAAVVTLVRAQVDAIDRFNDLSDATGASVENISALDGIARRTGGTFDTVGTALVKFNASLREVDPDSEAGRTFKALGLDVAKLKQLDPAEALRQTAIAMQDFARDGNLARATQTLFGKSVQEVAPFLKDLAEQQTLTTRVTTQQAEEAERLVKQLASMRAESEELKRELVSGLIPALSRMLENYRAIKELGSLDLVLKDAAKGLLGMNTRLDGDPGQKINQVIAERTKLEADLKRAQDDGHKPHIKAVQEEIAAVSRYLEVLRVKQRTEILGATLEKDNADALSRKLEGAKRTLSIPDKADPKLAALIEQGKQLAQGLTAQEGGLTPDFYEKWDKLSAAYKANAISLEKLTDAQRQLLKQQPFMKRELFLGDTTNDALSRRLDATERERKNVEDLNNEIARLADGGDGRKRALTEQLEARLNAGETFAPDELDRIVRGIAGINQEFAQTDDIASKFATQFTSRFEDAIFKAESLRDVIQGLGVDLTQVAIRTAVTEPLGKAAGNWAKGALAGLIPFADGGVMTSAGPMPLRTYAGGGVASSPQVAIYGEGDMNEAFVPLPDGRRIPVAMKGGGGGRVTIHNHMVVGEVASMAQVQEQLRASERRTAAAVHRARTYGGAFA
jgi:hypothetical protein